MIAVRIDLFPDCVNSTLSAAEEYVSTEAAIKKGLPQFYGHLRLANVTVISFAAFVTDEGWVSSRVSGGIGAPMPTPFAR